MAGKSYNRPIPHQDYIKLKYLSESDSIDLQTRKKKKLLKAATRHKKYVSIKPLFNYLIIKSLNYYLLKDSYF